MMDEVTFFLGLQVKQLTDGIFIYQTKYVADLLKRFGFFDSKLAKTPMSPSVPLSANLIGVDVKTTLHRGMIGPLLYLTVSHPDIMFVAILCSRYQANPK